MGLLSLVWVRVRTHRHVLQLLWHAETQVKGNTQGLIRVLTWSSVSQEYQKNLGAESFGKDTLILTIMLTRHCSCVDWEEIVCWLLCHVWLCTVNVVDYEYWDVVVDSSVILGQLTAVALYATLFIFTYTGVLTVPVLLSLALFLLVLGFFTRITLESETWSRKFSLIKLPLTVFSWKFICQRSIPYLNLFRRLDFKSYPTYTHRAFKQRYTNRVECHVFHDTFVLPRLCVHCRVVRQVCPFV